MAEGDITVDGMAVDTTGGPTTAITTGGPTTDTDTDTVTTIRGGGNSRNGLFASVSPETWSALTERSFERMLTGRRPVVRLNLSGTGNSNHVPVSMTHIQIPGFSVYYSRHTKSWAWKEAGSSTSIHGYSSQKAAVSGIKIEMDRRGQVLRVG